MTKKSKYNRYSKDSTIEKKVLANYGLPLDFFEKKTFEDGGSYNSDDPRQNNTTNVGQYAQYAQTGIQGVTALSQDDPNKLEAGVQGTVKGVGSSIPFYQAGSTIDNLAFKKDETGAYKNDTQAVLSYQFANPSQNLGQNLKDAKNKKYGRAALGYLAPGMAGIAHQQDIKDEERLREKDYLMANSTSGVRGNGQMFFPEQNTTLGGIRTLKDGGQLTQYNGLVHEQGGIPLGSNAEVEDQETRYADNIFSNSLQYDKKNTYADQSKKIDKKYSLRPNDSYSLKAKEMELNNLFNQQESFKMGGKLKKGGCVNKFEQGGRIKFFGGGDANKIKRFDPPTDINAFLRLAKADPNLVASSGIDPTKLKGYDAKKHSDLVLGYKEGAKYKRQPEAKNKRYISDTEAKGIIREALDKGDIDRASSFRPDLYEAVIAEGNHPQYAEQLSQNTIEQLPAAEVTADRIPKSSESTQEALPINEVDPIRPDYLGMAASVVPGALGAIGNAYLANQVNYQSPGLDQVRLQHLDPTRASQEIRGAYAGTNEAIRQNAQGAGNYLANRLASAAGETRGLSNVYADYDNRNTGIDNQERLTNFAAKNRWHEINADIKNRETQDRLGYRAEAMNQGITGIGRGIDYGLRDRRFRQTLPLMSEDYNVGWDPDTKTYRKYKDNDEVYKLRGSNRDETIAPIKADPIYMQNAPVDSYSPALQPNPLMQPRNDTRDNYRDGYLGNPELDVPGFRHRSSNRDETINPIKANPIYMRDEAIAPIKTDPIYMRDETINPIKANPIYMQNASPYYRFGGRFK